MTKNKNNNKKANKPKNNNNAKNKSSNKNKRVSNPKNPSFGAVSTISTAPVAIGNSMKGFTSQVVHTSKGCKVYGRDYAFTAVNTGSIITWALAGGMPLTPCCMPSTILRNFVQMYNRFRWCGIQFHYITSSATSTNGDIVFYHSKNAAAQIPEWSSQSFLPYILSDSNTVIGPQWTNHTLEVDASDSWYSTDYGADALNESEYSPGDVFLFSQTSSTESPGYIVFDYCIEFAELNVNPRSGILPLLKAQWTPVAFTNTVVATADTSNIVLVPSTSGMGGTTYVIPTSYAAGDVYEFILDSVNSSFGTGSSAATGYSYKPISTATVIAIKNGLKMYLKYDSATNVRWFPTLAGALNGSEQVLAHQTITYSDTLRGYVKFITTDNPATYQQAY